MKLVFRHLYNDKYAHFPKKEKWQTPVIVLASGFVPEVGKSYKCDVADTMMGSFVYDGVRYDLSIATLSNEAGILDKLGPMSCEFEERMGLRTPMADAFEKAKKERR
uniref:Uncharacterized protein n=1 Tax=viral metagenome TaxID=1070528 RepID=A0A6M3MA20_9ZZZZ